jgi:hypothetical protein
LNVLWAIHFLGLKTLLGRLKDKKNEYDTEAREHTPLKLRQKIGHGIGRAALTVTLGSAGVVGRALLGNPRSSHDELKKHSTRAALRLGIYNGALGLLGGGLLKFTESKDAQLAENALDFLQGPWPTAILVGSVAASLLLTRRSDSQPSESAADQLQANGETKE